jgi:hypothetical protein
MNVENSALIFKNCRGEGVKSEKYHIKNVFSM